MIGIPWKIGSGYTETTVPSCQLSVPSSRWGVHDSLRARTVVYPSCFWLHKRQGKDITPKGPLTCPKCMRIRNWHVCAFTVWEKLKARQNTRPAITWRDCRQRQPWRVLHAQFPTCVHPWELVDPLTWSSTASRGCFAHCKMRSQRCREGKWLTSSHKAAAVNARVKLGSAPSWPSAPPTVC